MVPDFLEQVLAYEAHKFPKLSSVIELSESYFGGPRKKRHAENRRKRGRGADKDVPVFGVLLLSLMASHERRFFSIFPIVAQKKTTGSVSSG